VTEHPHGPHAHRVEVEVPSITRALWRRGGWRYFIFDLSFLLAWTGFWATVGLFREDGPDRWMLVSYAVSIAILTVAMIYRVASAHRIGFRMGTLAAAIVITQPSQERVKKILEGSIEIWQPSPGKVLLQLDVDDLEKHANGQEPER
jgi:hypothetical protein